MSSSRLGSAGAAGCREPMSDDAQVRRSAVVWSVGWVALAAVVALGIALIDGPTGEWTTVYLIERSLSLDNVFLISLLLTYFVVPAELRGRVVLIGIAVALVLRGIAIAGGLALIERVESVVYLFGALLVYVALRALRGTDEESDPAANPVLRVVRRSRTVSRRSAARSG